IALRQQQPVVPRVLEAGLHSSRYGLWWCALTEGFLAEQVHPRRQQRDIDRQQRLLPDVVFAQERPAAVGLHAGGEDTDGRRFSGPVGAEQAIDLARTDFERDARQRHDLELLLLLAPG